VFAGGKQIGKVSKWKFYILFPKLSDAIMEQKKCEQKTQNDYG
jgi:hypothetical protein